MFSCEAEFHIYFEKSLITVKVDLVYQDFSYFYI